MSATYDRLPHEYWWGGRVDVGPAMPLGDQPFFCDLATQSDEGDAVSNGQSAPLLISTTGRAILSDQPFRYRLTPQHIHIDGEASLLTAGTTLRDAYTAVSTRSFPPSGSTPALELLTHPQYNTWIEMPYTPTQDKVEAYGQSLLDCGMPPGVLMIDDAWDSYYGDFTFDTRRFPDPAAMTRRLHDAGFSLMLWMVPFISPDSPHFRALEKSGYLLRNADGTTAIRHWWNGYSAIVDMTHPDAQAWLADRLAALQNLGVDGFKFDAGDVGFYREGDLSYAEASPVEHCEAWARFGASYPFNEFRACWKMGGQPLGQRLKDKPPSWDASGIEALIPEVLAQGMIGHAFTCPDMIGGGEIGATYSQVVDQEFVVRYAQIAALMPMMQFSMNPARILDSTHLEYVMRAVALRERHSALICELAHHAARTGEPIIRPTAYHCPTPQAAPINDQFFLGPDMIVAPQIRRGATSRRVLLPSGSWTGSDGSHHDISQPCAWVEAATPLSDLLYFSRRA